MPSQFRADASRTLFNFCVNYAAASVLTPRRLRQAIYRMFGVRVETHWVSPRCFLGGPAISIGKRTFINYECFFDTFAQITIGSGCSLGMQVMLVTSTHTQGPRERRMGSLHGKPITIEDGCWLGARVTVLPGVTISKGCIVAAGALVTKDCLPDGIYAGVPARRIKDLDSKMAVPGNIHIEKA